MTIRLLPLFLLFSLPVAAQTGAREDGLRVLLVEAEPSTKEGLGRDLAATWPLRIRSARPGKVSDEDLLWAQSIMVSAKLTGKDEAWVLKAGRGGQGLVLCADAVSSLADSKNFSSLIGRARLGELEPAATPIAVAFPDQRGQVTQSLTHFWHRGHLREYVPDKKRTRLLAYAVKATAEAEVADKGVPNCHASFRTRELRFDSVSCVSQDLL